MKNVNCIVKVAIILLFILGVMVTARAQIGPGGSGPGGPGSGAPSTPGVPADNSVPFDGGLSLILLAAGAGVAKRNTYKVLKTL